MEGGRVVTAALGTPDPAGPSAASVAGYRRQREEALALKARQRATYGRARRGPETPAQALARALNIDEGIAYQMARNPYIGKLMESHFGREARRTEMDRMQTGRMALRRETDRTAMDCAGRRTARQWKD